jgi:hypothetical protein
MYARENSFSYMISLTYGESKMKAIIALVATLFATVAFAGEPAKAEAKKADAPKAEAKKADAPKAEAKKADAKSDKAAAPAPAKDAKAAK